MSPWSGEIIFPTQTVVTLTENFCVCDHLHQVLCTRPAAQSPWSSERHVSVRVGTRRSTGIHPAQSIHYHRISNCHCSHMLLKGLSYIHNSGYIHRDVKTSNALISETGIVKISDFGMTIRARKCNYTGCGPGNVLRYIQL